jgi:hypothetical protein
VIRSPYKIKSVSVIPALRRLRWEEFELKDGQVSNTLERERQREREREIQQENTIFKAQRKPLQTPMN